MKRLIFAFAAASVACLVLHKVSKTEKFCDLCQLGGKLVKDLV